MNEFTLVDIVSLIVDQEQDSMLPLYEAIPDLVVSPGIGLGGWASEGREDSGPCGHCGVYSRD